MCRLFTTIHVKPSPLCVPEHLANGTSTESPKYYSAKLINVTCSCTLPLVGNWETLLAVVHCFAVTTINFTLILSPASTTLDLWSVTTWQVNKNILKPCLPTASVWYSLLIGKKHLLSSWQSISSYTFVYSRKLSYLFCSCPMFFNRRIIIICLSLADIEFSLTLIFQRFYLSERF